MAFSSQDLFAFRRNIHSMYSQHARFEQCTLTHDDVMELFVEPSDRKALQDAARLYHIESLPSRAEFTEVTPHKLAQTAVTYKVNLTGRREYGFPKYALRIQQHASKELQDKLFEMAHSKLQLSMEYKLVEKTLDILNEVCSTPGQVAFFWPSIFVIMEQPWGRADFSAKLREDLRKRPKKIPGMFPELRHACQETALTLAGYQMLGPPPADTETVHLNFTAVPVSTPLGTVRVSG
jgi:hypothetical protein